MLGSGVNMLGSGVVLLGRGQYLNREAIMIGSGVSILSSVDNVLDSGVHYVRQWGRVG